MSDWSCKTACRIDGIEAEHPVYHKPQLNDRLLYAVSELVLVQRALYSATSGTGSAVITSLARLTSRIS